MKRWMGRATVSGLMLACLASGWWLSACGSFDVSGLQVDDGTIDAASTQDATTVDAAWLDSGGNDNDIDNDGIANEDDNCPAISNPVQGMKITTLWAMCVTTARVCPTSIRRM